MAMINIPYLEEIDFNSDGSLKSYVTNDRPVILMVQGNFCGYCKSAKPAFQQLSSETKDVNCVTLQIDGGLSEKNATKFISMLDPSYKGVPVYLGFSRDGRYLKTHSGDRDVNSLKAFVDSL